MNNDAVLRTGGAHPGVSRHQGDVLSPRPHKLVDQVPPENQLHGRPRGLGDSQVRKEGKGDSATPGARKACLKSELKVLLKIEFIKPHVTTLAAGKLLRFKTHLHSLSCNFYRSHK